MSHLQITHEGDKGLGVRATRPFVKGELVCEYAGDLLDQVHTRFCACRYCILLVGGISLPLKKPNTMNCAFARYNRTVPLPSEYELCLVDFPVCMGS
jgi:hypothetical protein